MNQEELEKVKVMVAYLKEVGVLDRKPAKVVMVKAEAKFQAEKRKNLYLNREK
jgi:hypothetical protein